MEPRPKTAKNGAAAPFFQVILLLFPVPRWVPQPVLPVSLRASPLPALLPVLRWVPPPQLFPLPDVWPPKQPPLPPALPWRSRHGFPIDLYDSDFVYDKKSDFIRYAYAVPGPDPDWKIFRGVKKGRVYPRYF